ncbi:MAG: tRNA1(Val) (adenine(37)-N6)-methyltransferase [Endozoicomonas sp.]
MARARNSHFQFKQFRIEQDQCAMKVTTDACIFGARTDVENSRRILDIGAGSGLLSLMAAQRTSAVIDALEIDELAAKQAEQNFSSSPWANRLQLIHSSVQSFQSDDGYDTIICNPPFFHNALKAPDSRRNMARHTDTLCFSDLASVIERLMTDDGSAWVLLPVASSSLFLEESKKVNLDVEQLISLRSSIRHNDHRHIFVLRKGEGIATTERLTIYKEGSEYSDQVITLLKSYYLHV